MSEEKDKEARQERIARWRENVTNENTYVSRDVLGDCLEAMSQAYTIYPDKSAFSPLIDWFPHDAQDAMDMGISLEGGKFDGYSDIAIMQKEWYVEEVLKNPFIAALRVLSEAGLLRKIEPDQETES